jgi:transcriptional regulator with XRE-family HTH domain
MSTGTLIPIPKLSKLLSELGENIRLARLRRRLTTDQVCERADIGRTTLWQIEKGMPNVAIGAYAQVLFVLGLEGDISRLGEDDVLGRRLQDADLEIGRRGPKKK